jgi:hypothetical protein
MVAFGYISDDEDRRDYPARMALPREVPDLPVRWSLRKQMGRIRDQGNLGSCVGFACVALKEFQEKLQRPKTPFRDASEMWVYWKAKEIDRWPNLEGTGIRYALKVLARTGVPTERAWPYIDRKAKGNKPPTKPAFWAAMVARWGKISKYFRLDSLNEMREWLFLNGPVVIGVPVGSTIINPRTHPDVPGKSYVTLPTRFEGGHAIVLTGYNHQDKYFEFKNSWGIDWGNRGYGYITFNYLNKVAYDAWGVHDV